MNKLQIQRLKISNWRKAFAFAKELIGMKTPKKTVIISMMAEHKIPVREARNLYRAARADHRKRHMKARTA
jgi:hypothetical protein